MNHLIQVARRTNKTATGYKVQLVVHRMTAHLPASYDGVELCAMISRHKKRVTTKCACYLADKHEVVWGDILPFATTLYLAKTGLYQAKVFQVSVFDTRTDHLLATFEFNLAELVQSAKDSSKESIMVPAVKGQDPRASLSLTAIAVKATSVAAAQFASQPDGSNAEEMSFSGSQSDMSVITLESKSSRASMSRYGRSQVTSPGGGDGKSDGLRSAHPANESSDAVELYSLRSKHQELMRSVQDLEEQLRQSESENVKLTKKLSEKDAVIAKLQGDKQELEAQLQQTPQERPASQSDSETESVDTARMARLAEENEALQKERMEWKEKLRVVEEERSQLAALPPIPVTVNLVKEEDEVESDNSSDSEEEEEEQERREEKRSEAVSSANEYVDAHDSQLLGEIADLKLTLKTIVNERETQQSTVSQLTKLKDQLTGHVHGLEGKLAVMEGTIKSLEHENASQRQQLKEQAERLRDAQAFEDEKEARGRTESMEAQRQNEKLVQQLSHLDSLVTKLTDEKEALALKLKQAENSQDEAQREMALAQDAIGKLTGSNHEIHEQLQTAQEATDHARQEIKSAQLTIDELREQVRELSEKLQSTQSELEALRDGELAASAAAAAAAIAKNQELQGRWDDLKLQNEQLQSRVDELEQRLAQIEANGEEREADLQRQVKALKQETAQLREDLDELRASKQQAEEELHDCASELKQVLENQQRMTYDHVQAVGELGMEKEDAQSRVAEQMRGKEAMEAAMKKRLAELEQENDYFQGELIDSKMKLAELTARNEELSSQYHRVEKSLNELKAKAAEPAPTGKKK